VKAQELKQKYFDFFIKRGHQKLPNVSLVPENDPTALFISAGMHPLVPYLRGEPHPLGKRLVSLQRCLRTTDIEQVGDVTYNSFFEMLGNWSLGDYWKKEAISWSFEFLTKELGLSQEKISVSCFAGDKDARKDEESAEIWQSLGIPSSRIYFLGKEDNWWGPAGQTGPCGPDTEMFIDIGKEACGKNCRPGCHCGKYFEVWNDVFMEYEKKLKTQNSKLENDNLDNNDFEFVPLKQKNVDTGMGIERTTAMLQGKDDVFATEIFSPIIQKIEEISHKKYEGENKKPMRIMADHLRAAVFIIADGVEPSNVEQGYVLRRLIRRAIRAGRNLQLAEGFTSSVGETVIKIVDQEEYPHLKTNRKKILESLQQEESKFQKTLSRGLKEIEKYKKLDGKIAFYLYESYGFPLELTKEIAQERGQKIDKKVFEEEFKRHQELSRTASSGMFKGGLADHSEIVTQYHTATHLLNAALRQVLGPHVFQKGSNITSERLRFDFPNPEKLTPEQIKAVEDLINQKIKENLPVEMEMMTLEEAKKRGAAAVFGEKYGEKVKVYKVGDFSLEVCGGPHVDFTGKLGKFKIIKEEAVGSGVRRLYAELEQSA
jgi:alanyl-tRNA synthetase